MTTTPTQPSKPARPARRPTSLGQWLVDGKEPLNGNEVLKKADDGLNVKDRIISTYAAAGFDAIPEDDLTGRFRWYGLYTQRKQGIDGSRTSKLDADELSDKYFMMRVRIDGGQLTTDQLRVVAGISTEFARDSADITDRQNIQLHWVGIEDVPEIWARLEAVGLSTTEACGDVPRVILGSPVAGIAADEIVDPTPIIRDISERYIGNPELSNLPRKYKTAFTGHPSLDVVHEINDISFVGVIHPEHGPGFDLWVGGGLSTVPRLAQRLGAWVSPERAAEVWYGVTRIFRDYGYRKQRTRNRLKFLIDDWGVEKFRQVLEDDYLDAPLPDGPAPAKSTAPGDHIGIHDQKDGRKYVGVAPTVGRVSGTLLTQLAETVERAGSGRIRLTPHQKVLVLDVDPDRVESLVAELDELGLHANPSPFRRSTIACTGIEYCKLAFVETKQTAADAITELERRLAGVEVDPPISLNVNGCQNSCARIQVADIGLKGQLIGGDEFGFQVHLGGGLASDDRDEAGLGRTVRGLKVTATDLPDYVERVVRRFLEEREGEETFSAWVHRADDEALR
ncbi:MAG TPA: nitrite/sulfite reductase [Candidatus Avipropionibacterium avicola]|uniref:assimilatory sulfite reductase (ferredoxin) n=1 Tax=Candidatus Avipropionibacterium avicola TaxID=2840701 RepID=A0A9D1KNK7_9ACTN|nr:nitrite/sulfite reductase [Candidatus Avipropionibacterium avicola]